MLGQRLCPPAVCGTGWALVLFSLGTQAPEMCSIICTGTIRNLNAWGEMKERTVTMPSSEQQQKSWFELCLPPALLLSVLRRLLLSLPLGFSPFLVLRHTTMVWAKKAKLHHFQENTNWVPKTMLSVHRLRELISWSTSKVRIEPLDGNCFGNRPCQEKTKLPSRKSVRLREL